MASLELAPVTGLGATDPVAASAEKAASRLASYGAQLGPAAGRPGEHHLPPGTPGVIRLTRRRSPSPSLTLSITPAVPA